MKRTLVILLVAAFLLTVISGCASNDYSPIRICVDIKDLLVLTYGDEFTSVQSNEESAAAELFLNSIKDREGPEDVELEFIPATGDERNAVLTRIRTEILSGKGPDVFIVNCVNDGQIDALFQSPEAAMELKIFLPLDEYINSAKYMEWDKMTSIVMAAGKNKEGQQLLPLSYTFPVSIFKREDISTKLPQDATLYDMLDAETNVAAAALTNSFYRHSWSDYAFGAVVDYENEKLLFTENDLLKWEQAQQSWFDRLESGEFDDVPNHYSMSMNVGFNNDAGVQGDAFFSQVSQDDEMVFLPMYSTQGGVTATVLSFAGVNRNTKRPDDAFRVLDALFDREVQQYSGIFKILTNMRGIPVHQELMQEEYPVAGWYMGKKMYQVFCAVRNQITCVKFRSTFEN